jgi:hypothetical protein
MFCAVLWSVLRFQHHLLCLWHGVQIKRACQQKRWCTAFAHHDCRINDCRATAAAQSIQKCSGSGLIDSAICARLQLYSYH